MKGYNRHSHCKKRLPIELHLLDLIDSHIFPQHFNLIPHQQKNHLEPHLSPLTLCAGRSRRL